MTDVLPVVAVTFSPGPHLERFLASLSHATERPVSVVLADNGSTDGTPQAAVERYSNVRLFETGANLGYGTAVNRAVAALTAEEGADDDWVMVANPDVQWGPGSIDALLDAAARWPRAGALGPLIRDPDGSVYPSARHLPSLIRGGMHAVLGTVLAAQSVDGGLPPGAAGAQRTPGRLVVGVVPAGAPVGFQPGRRIRRALLHVYGGRRPR